MTFNATPPTQTYTYDQKNRLTGAAAYTYTYHGDGNRVRKSNGNLAANGTLYWYMTPSVVAETDLAGTLNSEYIFFDGERVARRDGVNGAGGVFYYFSDHLKTASVITNSAGVIMAESDYYPWGGELQFVANDSNDYKFTGKKRDSETGLDYFGARYYSNGLGRFITPDWAAKPAAVPYAVLGDPQTLNLYTYVRNIPTTNADPDGHCPQCDLESWAIGKISYSLVVNHPQAAFVVEHPRIAMDLRYSKSAFRDPSKTNLKNRGQTGRFLISRRLSQDPGVPQRQDHLLYARFRRAHALGRGPRQWWRSGHYQHLHL